MVGEEEKIEDLFAAWLAQNASSAQLSELYFYYSEIEAYCLKIKVLHKPLFETIDLDTIKKVQKSVTESRIFQLSHKKQMRKIVAAAHYYTAFVKSLVDKEIITTESDISQTMRSGSCEERLRGVAQRKEIILNENERDDDTLIIDFHHINSLEHTKPVSFSYCGGEQVFISNWAQLYVKVLAHLSEDYTHEFLQMHGTNISGGRRIDFGSSKAAEKMNAPKMVDYNFYVETNLSATDIVTKIRLVLDRCNVDYEKLEIRYKKIDSTQCTELSLVKNAQQRMSSVTKNTMSVTVTSDTGDYKALFRDWLVHDRYMAERSAQSYSSAITNCEQLAGRLGLPEVRLYGANFSEAQRVVDKLRQTNEYRKVNVSQHNRYNAAVSKYLLYLQSSGSQEITASVALNNKEPEQHGTDFDRFFEGEKYDLCNIELKNKGVEPPKRKTTDLSAKDLQKSTETPETYISAALTQAAENYLLQCDLKGVTYDELQSKLHYTMAGTKEIVAQSSHIIEMNRKLYHEEALVDFEEGADTLESVLDKLLKKNDGVATAKHLYEYACSEMAMFFNDNGITDQQSVYDLARHLFEKLKYNGKYYVFKSNMYISLPEYSADSVIDIVSKYAREKGTTVTYDELVRYLTGLGSNTGNLRGLMRIDKEPVFLIYAENEYLLAELMHIDTDFLESIHCALRRLFEDTDGHIIPRNISESWYNLLPTLPACLPWTPMLLQQLIRFYPDELEARTIIAMESQNSNTLHAMFVEKDSWIQDFRDVVAVFLHNEMPSRYEFEAEELRGILVDAGMISGNQLIYNMPNALGGDPRFLWDSDGNHVKVRI